MWSALQKAEHAGSRGYSTLLPTCCMRSTDTEAPRSNYERLFAMGALLVATMVILRNAWASDDAYITMRTVDHFCHGRGLTWTPGERVQAYTQPLWMLLLSAIYCVVEDAYATLIGLVVLTSVAALIVLARCHARNFAMAGAMILVLVSTRSFVDYSTSGLENPLTHLLLGIYLWVFWEHQ